jgi:hypothetical protein
LVTVGIAAKDQRADRDRLVHVAAPAEVAHGAAIELAGYRLEFVDQLHGAYLGRAHQRTRGKGCGEQVECVLRGIQAALHAAHDMHDMAVALDHPVGIDGHRARDRHAPQIVAREIDEHHVLCILFRIAQQFGFQRRIASLVRAARPRTGNGAQLRLSCVAFHERFRGRSHHGDIPELAKKHVRRGIEQPQRAIGFEWRQGMAAFESRREHELVHVARRDIFLRAPHAGRMRFLGQRG